MKSKQEWVRLFTDGAARGNPGPAAAGVVVTDMDGEVLDEGSYFLGASLTNNVAEYQALLYGLELAQAHGENIEVFSDSELMVKQLNGDYQVKHADLKPLYAKAKVQLGFFAKSKVQHVRREQNRRADELANQALDRRRNNLPLANEGASRDPRVVAPSDDFADSDDYSDAQSSLTYNPATQKRIRSIAILGKRGRSEVKELSETILRWAEKQDYEVFLDSELREHGLKTSAPFRDRLELCRGVDLLFVLGGDGTLIAGARAAVGFGTAVVGINLGGLGFLTEVTPAELPSLLTHIAAGNLERTQRHLMRATLRRAGKELGNWVVLNDVVINKAAMARLIYLTAQTNGEFVTRYKSDGLIVSTPTGSTAYSLSAGGPIVEPGVDCFILTPICPHALTNRTLVLPTAAPIRLTLDDANGSVYLTLDGQEGIELQEGDEVLIERFKQRLELISSISKNYYEILRTKLMWGQA